MKAVTVIENGLLPARGFLAITLFGAVFTRDRRRLGGVMLHHEMIHCRQQAEWLWIPFFLLYAGEWLWHLVRTRDALRAYHAISFEREAYSHEREAGYLRRRPLFANYRRR